MRLLAAKVLSLGFQFFRYISYAQDLIRIVNIADSVSSERYPLTSQLIQENKIPEFGAWLLSKL